jgi:hypothetical protein
MRLNGEEAFKDFPLLRPAERVKSYCRRYPFFSMPPKFCFSFSTLGAETWAM